MESHKEVENSKSVLSVEHVHLPVSITEWVFIEARDVLVGSPSLSIVSWLVELINELCEVTVGVFGQSTIKHTVISKKGFAKLTVQPCQHAR